MSDCSKNQYSQLQHYFTEKYNGDMEEILKNTHIESEEEYNEYLMRIVRVVCGDEYLQKIFLANTQGTRYQEHKNIEQYVRCYMQKVFDDFFYVLNLPEFNRSVELEVLYYIRANSTRKDDEYKIVTVDNGEIKFYKTNVSRYSEIQNNVYGVKSGTYELQNHLNCAYQIKLQAEPIMKNFIVNGSRKKRDFKTFYEDLTKFEKGLEFFEQYIIEKQTCVFTSLIIYNLLFEFLEIPGDRRKKEVQTILEDVALIAKNISNCHNLYFRSYLLTHLGDILDMMKKDTSISIEEGVKMIADAIEVVVEEFNELYDDIYRALLVLVEKQDNVLDMMEKHIQCFEVMKCFDDIIKQVKLVKEDNSNVNTYVGYKIYRLWYANNKSKYYNWYKYIWENTNRGYREIKLLR